MGAQENFYGLARDTFTDLNSGIGGFSAGYSVQGLDGKPQPTASVIAGENGQGPTALAPMMEHAEKYAYIGRGYDKLTVTPMRSHDGPEGHHHVHRPLGRLLCDRGGPRNARVIRVLWARKLRLLDRYVPVRRRLHARGLLRADGVGVSGQFLASASKRNLRERVLERELRPLQNIFARTPPLEVYCTRTVLA